MHPLIARFIDLPVAVATLDKLENEATLDSDESAFINAASAFPKARAAVLKARNSKSPSPEAQQQLIVLAVRAAAGRLAFDPTLGPRVATAKAALEKEGATPEEAEALIAQTLLEEAFGYAEDPEAFDADFVAETLESLVYLATVTQESIDGWLEAFSKKAPAGDRPLAVKVAETLLEAAWSDGPQPITPEHLDDAIDQLAQSVASSEVPKAIELVIALLAFLAEQRILGPERRKRLEQIAGSARNAGVEVSDEEEEEDADEDE
ncbi:MAG: hypothetical protein ACOZQL_37385 [Myxococcota bacterium]